MHTYNTYKHAAQHDCSTFVNYNIARQRHPRLSEWGDDTVGNPHRAQTYQIEFFELKLFSSSLSSLSSY